LLEMVTANQQETFYRCRISSKHSSMKFCTYAEKLAGAAGTASRNPATDEPGEPVTSGKAAERVA